MLPVSHLFSLFPDFGESNGCRTVFGKLKRVREGFAFLLQHVGAVFQNIHFRFICVGRDDDVLGHVLGCLQTGFGVPVL